MHIHLCARSKRGRLEDLSDDAFSSARAAVAGLAAAGPQPRGTGGSQRAAPGAVQASASTRRRGQQHAQRDARVGRRLALPSGAHIHKREERGDPQPLASAAADLRPRRSQHVRSAGHAWHRQPPGLLHKRRVSTLSLSPACRRRLTPPTLQLQTKSNPRAGQRGPRPPLPLALAAQGPAPAGAQARLRCLARGRPQRTWTCRRSSSARSPAGWCSSAGWAPSGATCKSEHLPSPSCGVGVTQACGAAYRQHAPARQRSLQRLRRLLERGMTACGAAQGRHVQQRPPQRLTPVLNRAWRTAQRLAPPTLCTPLLLRTNRYAGLWRRSGEHEVLSLRTSIPMTLMRWRGVVTAGNDIDRVARLHIENPAMPTIYHIFRSAVATPAARLAHWAACSVRPLAGLRPRALSGPAFAAACKAVRCRAERRSVRRVLILTHARARVCVLRGTWLVCIADAQHGRLHPRRHHVAVDGPGGGPRAEAGPAGGGQGAPPFLLSVWGGAGRRSRCAALFTCAEAGLGCSARPALRSRTEPGPPLHQGARGRLAQLEDGTCSRRTLCATHPARRVARRFADFRRAPATVAAGHHL